MAASDYTKLSNRVKKLFDGRGGHLSVMQAPGIDDEFVVAVHFFDRLPALPSEQLTADAVGPTIATAIEECLSKAEAVERPE